MKKSFQILLIFCVGLLLANPVQAQLMAKGKSLLTSKPVRNSEDSLLREISNGIYYTYYSPGFMRNKTTVFTVLKVDINWEGTVTGMHFSDSADKSFSEAYFNGANNGRIKATFEAYAKAKSYVRLSLLIPVSYQPGYPNQSKNFSFKDLESISQFDKQSVTGGVVLLSPINIHVQENGEM